GGWSAKSRRQVLQAHIDRAVEAVEPIGRHVNGQGAAFPNGRAGGGELHRKIGTGRTDRQTIGVILPGLVARIADANLVLTTRRWIEEKPRIFAIARSAVVVTIPDRHNRKTVGWE